MDKIKIAIGIPSGRDIEKAVSIIRDINIPNTIECNIVIARWLHRKLTTVEMEIISTSNFHFDIVYASKKYPPNLRNAIIDYVTEGYILFLDDDVRVDPNILYESIKLIETSKNTVFQAPPYFTANENSWLANMEGKAYKKGFLSYVNGKSTSLLDARTLLAPVNILKFFKFDDKLIFGGEGRELATRMLNSAINLEMAESIVSRHYNRDTITALYFQKITHGRGRGQEIKNNKIGIYKRLKYYVYYFNRHFIKVIFDLFNGKNTLEETIYSLMVNVFFWIGVFDQLLFNRSER